MKTLNRYIILFSVFFVALFQACVNDDSFFPDEQDDVVSSIAIVTVLQNFAKTADVVQEENQCFKFVYPIVLGYNTNSSIQVDNYQGLLEILNSQRANFNISGLQFPFQLMFNQNDAPITIADEVSFLSVLGDCQFNTLRQDYDRYRNECFQLQYPVSIFDNEQNEINLNSVEDLEEFLIKQGASYQPKFKFPVVIFQESNVDVAVEITTYFDFYRIFENCTEGCPDLTISSTLINDITLDYNFAVTSSDPSLQIFSWFVNGEFIRNVNGSEFEYRFDTPGNYEICVLIETPQCPEGIEKCIKLNVPKECPALNFEWEQLPDSFEYRFVANFERREDMSYQWFIDGEPFEEDGGPNGDHTFVQLLEPPGNREVCIKANIRSCPDELLEYCEIIQVGERCPELSFVVEQTKPMTFEFFADFPNIANTSYSWFVNDVFIENDGGANGDNQLSQSFEIPGNYRVCIIAETPDCPSSVEFCEEIMIP